MKKVKKGLSFVLVLLMCIMPFAMFNVSATGQVVESGRCGGSATFELNSDGELVIRGSGEIALKGESVFKGKIKNVIINEGIIGIGKDAFVSCARLRSIIIPKTVTSIGSAAFASCVNLTSITIPDGVTEIFPGTFRGCRNLESVTIANGNTTIWDKVFDGCSANLTIISHKGGEVEKYATEKNIKFQDINASGFTLSDGNWWIIAAGAVVIVGGVVAIVVANKKKKKPALASGENKDEE